MNPKAIVVVVMEQQTEKRSIVEDNDSSVKRQDTSWSKGVAHLKPEYIVPVSYTHLDVYKRQP